MTIDQFWDSNPWEIRVLSEGYSERMRDVQEIHAGLTASTINTLVGLWSKSSKRYKPEDLIGKRRSGPGKKKIHFNDYLEKHEGDVKKAMAEMSLAVEDLKKSEESDTVW